MTKVKIINSLLCILEHGDPRTMPSDIELLLEGVADDDLPVALVDQVVGWAHEVKRLHYQRERFFLWLKELAEEEGDSDHDKKYQPVPGM